MGTLSAFPIGQWRSMLKLTCMVETGTWKGDGVAYALSEGFNRIHSIDMNLDFVTEARGRFTEVPGLTIWHDVSVSALPSILAQVRKERVLWWLDAHLQDFYGMPIAATHPLPLRQELEIIAASRDVSHDVFIIDDLRIYEDIPGEHNWPERIEYARYGNQGIEFIYKSLALTHTIHRDFRDQGYVLALPKTGTESNR